MISLNKLKRELSRPFGQLKTLPERLKTYLFATRNYDRHVAPMNKFSKGSKVFGKKVAIFVIYPKLGMIQTQLNTVKYLISKRYSVVVVLNLKVSAEQKELLLQNSWAVLERQNVGYDFGAYRDGILLLKPYANDIEKLLLLNDSCWFPVPGSRDWIDQAEALELDLASSSTHYGLDRSPPESNKKNVSLHQTDHRNFHYGSFSILLDQNIIRSKKFFRFWNGLVLTSDKKLTVRYGEQGFTRWVIKNGFSHGCTMNYYKIKRSLEALPLNNLIKVAQETIVFDDLEAKVVKRKLLSKSTSLSKEILIRLIFYCAARQGTSYSFAKFLIEEHGHAFLKKSPIWHDKEAADITLALTENFKGHEGQAICQEANALRQSAS